MRQAGTLSVRVDIKCSHGQEVAEITVHRVGEGCGINISYSCANAPSDSVISATQTGWLSMPQKRSFAGQFEVVRAG